MIGSLLCRLGFHKGDGSRSEPRGGWNEIWSRCVRCTSEFCIETDDYGP